TPGVIQDRFTGEGTKQPVMSLTRIVNAGQYPIDHRQLVRLANNEIRLASTCRYAAVKRAGASLKCADHSRSHGDNATSIGACPGNGAGSFLWNVKGLCHRQQAVQFCWTCRADACGMRQPCQPYSSVFELQQYCPRQGISG